MSEKINSRYHIFSHSSKWYEGKYACEYTKNKILKIEFEKLPKENITFTRLFENLLILGVAKVELYKNFVEKESVLTCKNFIYKGTAEQVFKLFLGFERLWFLNPEGLIKFVDSQKYKIFWYGDPIELLSKIK